MRYILGTLFICVCSFLSAAESVQFRLHGNFENRHIASFTMPLGDEQTFERCNLRGATIDFWDVDLTTDWNTCDVTDCWFGGGGLDIPQEQLIKTRNFKEKRFPLTLSVTSLKNLDLTDFEFSDGYFSGLDVSGSCMKNVLFVNCMPPPMTMEQWRQTRNYTEGNFDQVQPLTPWSQIDLSRTVWTPTRFPSTKYVPRMNIDSTVNIENSVFIQCDLRFSKNLTLEQVKSTWNYKAGRMNLSKWPENIEKELGTEYFGDPYATGLRLNNPSGECRETFSEVICFTGKIGICFSNKPQPHFYYENARFLQPARVFSESLNHKVGLFIQCDFCNRDEIIDHYDLSGITFVGCKIPIYFQYINLTDSVFIDCDLTESRGLTLEQVKSTWNYKNNRMNLSKWPDSIMKALENEK